MSDEFLPAYPEAAPYIRQAVAEHGEDWVIDNYHPKISQLGVVMDVPDVEELPFYDPDKHEVMSESEQVEMATAMREYRENLRTGHKPGEDG